MKKPILYLAVLLLACAPKKEAVNTPVSEPTPGNPLSLEAMTAIYNNWWSSPYEYMFKGDGRCNEGLEIGKHTFCSFDAGMDGIMHYGGLSYATADYLKTSSQSWGDLTPIATLSGLPIRSKPGGGFKHINPDLIKWGHNNLIPDPNMELYGHTCQKIYNTVFTRFFRLMTESYVHLQKEMNWQQEVDAYQLATMKEGNLNMIDYLNDRYGRYLRKYEREYDGTNMTNGMAFGFWLRRGLDGTHDELYVGLEKLMMIYDKDWFKTHQL